MNNIQHIYAKSILYGGTTLLDHTKHVALCAEKMAKHFQCDFDNELAKKGAILHDLGKAHPYFQNRIKHKNEETLLAEMENDKYVHRHELSSLAFLPCFPIEEWNTLIDMVVAHHKSILNDSRNRGILDIKTNDRRWIENHLFKWQEWFPVGKIIIEHFGYKCPASVTIQDAKNALLYVVAYCESKRSGWSPWRGLLKAADHFASAFADKTEEKLVPIFETPDLSFYHDKKRNDALYPLSLINTTDSRRHTIVVAPTGAGKTDFLMRRTQRRVFYTLPFQASINAMWARFKDVIPNQDIRVLHSTSKVVVGKNNLDEQILQPLTGSSIKVLTPHQLASIIFGTAGFESVILDVKGCDIVLDEVHTYSDYSKSMVLEIVKVLIGLGCSIHIGTATMPTVLYEELLQILGGKEKVYEVHLPENELEQFNRHRIFKLSSDDKIEALVNEAVSKNEKVLLVYNTIFKAQQAFAAMEKLFPEVAKMLIHSRFRRIDRLEKELQLKNEFNGNGNDNPGVSPCIVIATQVVEVSLDISFDRMITECAPLDGLIQRFGRVNRIRNKGNVGKLKPVHVIAPKGNALPYKLSLLQKSFEQLPDSGEILLEKDLQQKIDNVYPKLNKKEIDIHLKFKNGTFIMKELTNNKKSVLIEILEIEGAICILEGDRQKYIAANWEDRIDLEIPVNWKSISKYRNELEQLKVGANPFVVPQSTEEYNKYGLQLIEHYHTL